MAFEQPLSGDGSNAADDTVTGRRNGSDVVGRAVIRSSDNEQHDWTRNEGLRLSQHILCSNSPVARLFMYETNLIQGGSKSVPDTNPDLATVVLL